MLTLRRRVREAIRIGSDVTITVLSVSGGTVKLAIDAPGQPVLRLELLQGIEAENQRAATGAGAGAQGETEPFVIHFPQGIFGLGGQCHFVLYDLDECHRVLVGRDDPTVALIVTDPQLVDGAYPVAEAQALYPFEADDVALCAIVTPNHARGMPTANLRAPLLIGTRSRKGVQVILPFDHLSIRTPVTAPDTFADVGTP